MFFRKVIFLILSIVIASQSLQGVKRQQANIIIVLDRESQYYKEAMQLDIDNAMEYQAPLLISGPCLENLIRRGKNIDPIYRIYKIENSDLYLMLPDNIAFKDAFNLKNAKEIESRNLSTIKSLGDYETDNWLDGVKSIFKKNTDFWWNIILHGHGNLYRVSGLKNKDFQRLISFLNNENLNVFFFYYASCFGGGLNLLRPYIYNQEDILSIKPLKFMVVSGAPREIPVIWERINYSKLFEELNKLLNFSELSIKKIKSDPMDILLRLLPEVIETGFLPNNFPLIKFPNSKFFISVRKDARVKVINNIIVQKHKWEDKPIIIPQKVEVIFVYPNIIEPNIEIEGKKGPLFISLDPGVAIHFFEEIKAPNISPFDFYRLFIEFLEVEFDKLFIIKNLLIGNREYKNVVIDAGKKEIFYEEDDFFYKRDAANAIKFADEEEFKLQISNKIEEILQILLMSYGVKYFGDEKEKEVTASWQIKPAQLIKYINKELELSIQMPSVELLVSSAINRINRYIKRDAINKDEFKVDRIINLSKIYSPLEYAQIQHTNLLLLYINKVYPIKHLLLDHSSDLTLLVENIGNFTNLETLSLQSDQLGSLPVEIGNLKKLEILNLQSNGLGSLPVEIGNLKKLEILNLQFNKLISLPMEIVNLTKLKELDLEWNRLISLPREFWTLSNLEKLNLGNNQLTLPPKEIGNLTKLKELNLMNNGLTFLPEELRNFRDLETLNLGYNKLMLLSKEIGNLTELKELDLANNQLTSLPEEIGNLTKLKKLNLMNNGLTFLPEELWTLRGLEKLNLANNQLTSLSKEIGNLTKLKELDLANNKLTSLPKEIGNLKELKKLDLADNQLTLLSKEIGNLTKLKELNLMNNGLTLLPEELLALRDLEKINLAKNQLKSFSKDIGNLINLKELNLSGNALRLLSKEICNLKNLTILILRNNNLTLLPEEIGNLTNLKELNLEGNQLTSLPKEIGNLTKLIRLYLQKNKLISLPEEIGNLTNLKELDLRNNSLAFLPVELAKLESLGLSVYK